MHRAAVFFVVCCLALGAGAGRRVPLGREVAPFEPDELRAAVWDTDRRSTLDDHAAVFTSAAAGAYYEWAPDRCRSYALRGDTLVYRGYNIGRHERMLLEGPAPSRLVGGGAPGAAFATAFAARGLLYDRFGSAETGALTAEVLAAGVLVAGGDSVGVMLQREVIEASKIYDGDSCAVAQRAVILRWLRPGEMHPLALQVQCGAEPPRLFVVPEVPAAEAEADGAPLQAPAPDDRAIMDVLESASAVLTPDGLELSLARGAGAAWTVNAYLIDTTGNIYASTTMEADGRCTLPVPGAYSGRLFVVVCCAERPELQYKFFAGL